MNVRIVHLFCLLLCLSTAAYAVTVYTLDENGNGSFSINGGPSVPMPSGLAVDPISGVLTLRYILPAPPASGGDVLLIGAPSDGNGPSDVLRFVNATTSLFFFSFIDDGADTPADTVPGLALQGNNTVQLETGPEGNNGLFGYNPTPGQPGFTGTPADSYNFISDKVPEPSSMVLGGLGLVLMFAAVRKRSWRS